MPSWAHGDTVGDGEWCRFTRGAAGGGNALLDRLACRISEMLQGAASFSTTATPTNGWWIWRCQTHRIEIRAVRRPVFRTLRHMLLGNLFLIWVLASIPPNLLPSPANE